MKKIPTTLAVSSLALLLCSLGQVVYADNYIDAPRPLTLTSFESTGRTMLVAAGADISIRNLARLPDGRRVRLNGTVDQMQGKNAFLLKDESGRIEVHLPGRKKLQLVKGEEVTVAGRIHHGLLGSTIQANGITPHTRATTAATDKEELAKHSQNTAPVYTIANLPETGMVKVSGIVTTSDNAHEFVLKDATGLVDVNVAEGNASHVLKGAHVTVVGLVDRGVLGKDISAHAIQMETIRIMASVE